MDKAIQNEIEAYLRKAEERLEVAKLLNEHAAFEDAVSRAYYAMHHGAQAALLTEGIRAKTHRGLGMLFGFHLVKQGKLPEKLAKYLKNIRDDREESDYDVGSHIDKETCQIAIREAEEFVQEIKIFLKRFGI